MVLLHMQHQLSKETPMSRHTEQCRHQAINNYLAEDKVEDICRQLACSKSWLYKWRGRYDAQNPPWAQERSKRPKSHPRHWFRLMSCANEPYVWTLRLYRVMILPRDTFFPPVNFPVTSVLMPLSSQETKSA